MKRLQFQSQIIVIIVQLPLHTVGEVHHQVQHAIAVLGKNLTKIKQDVLRQVQVAVAVAEHQELQSVH